MGIMLVTIQETYCGKIPSTYITFKHFLKFVTPILMNIQFAKCCKLFIRAKFTAKILFFLMSSFDMNLEVGFSIKSPVA